jgi:subtilisin family serine protease
MARDEGHDHSGTGFEELPDLELPEGVEGSGEDEPGGPHLRVSGEVLIAADDLDEASERLVGQELRVREPLVGDLPVAVVEVEDVARAMGALDVAEGRDLQAAPNHVFHPAPRFRWQTFEAPRPAEARPEVRDGATGDGARVAVLDTGAAEHGWFAGRVTIGAHDLEAPDEDGDGVLDANRGHGTFVSGVVLLHAPGASVQAIRVPELGGARIPGGLVDDLTVAQTLLSVDGAEVINLSLGGTTRSDVAPPAIAAALALLREREPDTVIVAAAGNDGWQRPIWPAAFKGVVAVGALDPNGDPASFSNRGWWVDAWAPGVDVHSTFLDWDGPLEHPLATSAATFEGWARWCGTSFAAPRVAGAIAAASRDAGGPRRAAFEMLAGGSSLGRVHGVAVDVPERV